MNGGDALVEALVAHGVDTAFTVPGESFLSVLEALRRNRNAIRLITVRQEGGGTFAAEAFGKLARRPAAVFVSRGPGATNAAIGVHTARQDSTPLLLFVGHVRRHSRGREAFQEIDQAAFWQPLAKAVLCPESADEVAGATAEAIRVSQAGRPGPVVMVLPRDVGEEELSGPGPLPSPLAEPVSQPDATALSAAVDLLDAARRPLVVAGELVCHTGAQASLQALAAHAGLPVLTAYRRQDAFDNLHPAYAGHLEINRVAYQSAAIAEADLILAVGSRLDGITAEDGAWPGADQQLVLLHPDPEVQARCAPAVTLPQDLGTTLKALKEAAAPGDELRSARLADLHRAYLDLSRPDAVTSAGAVDLAQVVAVTGHLAGPDAVVLSDAGSFSRWVHRFHRFRRPGTQAGPMSGAMGYGMPGAIGARLARPDAAVIAFVGDGSFAMTAMELATAVEQHLKLTLVVCDNAAHGSILQGQLGRYGEEQVYGTALTSPDFAAMARAMGAAAWRIERTEDYEPALRDALAVPGASLLHLITDLRDIAPYGPGKEAV